MRSEAILTCAVTGSGDTVGRHPAIPVTPAQIAQSSIEAARAGAAIVHVHVREPATGKGSRELMYYREVVERIRNDATDVIINLTTGMGSTWVVDDADLRSAGAGSDFVGPQERVEHILELRPEICSLDCGTMNFGADDVIEINIPKHVRAAAASIRDAGVKAELEVFDLGQMVLANQLVSEGLVSGTPLFQVCLGIRGGAPATTGALQSFLSLLPVGANWSAFGISRMQMPMVAQALLLGGNCRVGLEDNLYLARGVFASNAAQVQKAKAIIEGMGARMLTPGEARRALDLASP